MVDGRTLLHDYGDLGSLVHVSQAFRVGGAILTTPSTFNIAVIDGGRTGAFWGYVFVWVGYTCVIGSLSELVSMTPTAAGQYHWAYELAPPKYRKFISWFTGWQIVLAWQADFAAVLYLSGILIQAVAALN